MEVCQKIAFRTGYNNTSKWSAKKKIFKFRGNKFLIQKIKASKSIFLLKENYANGRNKTNSLQIRKPWLYNHEHSSSFLCFLYILPCLPTTVLAMLFIAAVLPQFPPNSYCLRREKTKVSNKQKISWSPLLKLVLLTRLWSSTKLLRNWLEKKVHKKSIHSFPLKLSYLQILKADESGLQV